jgi:Protein of unknown function (DUF3622)
MASRYTTRSSYYVAVFRTKERDSWYWEIRRKRKAMGVTLREGGFRTSEDAELAGKQVLEEFLNGLSVEANSK